MRKWSSKVYAKIFNLAAAKSFNLKVLHESFNLIHANKFYVTFSHIFCKIAQFSCYFSFHFFHPPPTRTFHLKSEVKQLFAGLIVLIHLDKCTKIFFFKKSLEAISFIYI